MRAEQATSGGPATSCYERYGCTLNRLSADELLERYMQTGFLYPDKLQRLAPFKAEILDNWRRAASSPDGLLRVVTFDGERQRSWASLATWRHTASGWCTQHLVSRGDPLATRAVMLAEQEATLEDPLHQSNQNWFRPDNRMPRRIFGAVIPRLGPEAAGANQLALFEMPLRVAPASAGLSVVPVDAASRGELVALAVAARGPAYAVGEGLTAPDITLAELDRLYRKVGLYRYRRAWLARDGGAAVAGLIAYRGPLGLNFSFIENRADLLASPACSPDTLGRAIRALLGAAAETYADFRPGIIPLFTDGPGAGALAASGCLPIRSYCQTIWLRSGYAGYLTHLHATFARVVERAERQKRRRERRDEFRLEAR